MRLCSLFSGGKDSIMALYRALINKHEVVVLLSMIPRSNESYMYHVPNIRLTEYSARAIGIPIVVRETSGGIAAEENLDLKNALNEIKSNFNINGIVVGVVKSNYQYNIISKICADLDLRMYAPYWQRGHEFLMREAIDSGFEIIITGVYAEGLSEDWLGRRLDMETINELRKLSERFGINIGGEGGEYETLVIDGPIFKKKLRILRSKRVWHKIRGELIIEDLELVDKD